MQAHVTPDEKQFADTQLANAFKDQRVIDSDQFELTFSLPDTSPQASCLNDPPPINSIPNGDGWFWNTTEAVPLVNQSDPAGGAGERPTQAQACLGRKTGGGEGNQRSRHRLKGRGGVQDGEQPHLRPVAVSSHREHPRRTGQ
ncbi:hypothetical protein ACH40F_45365 [Streptomyces sp. NPDC020794]|uniref:hypothetical protein n=1 Tax=unclassified Streptomyces TaxID=2593676 RepID=UPI0036EE65CE